MYRALVNFSSTSITMYRGQVADITDSKVISDLLSAGYIEEVKKEKPKKEKAKK